MRTVSTQPFYCFIGLENEARIDSDVDLLVEFDRPIGLFAFVRLKRYLEEILESSVDLGTPDSLKPYLREPVFLSSATAGLTDILSGLDLWNLPDR